jgi:type II secretory pathway component PulJ
MNRRAAFTLIELLASAVLTAMMMAGLLSVVWSAVRQSNELSLAERQRSSTTILMTQLRRDFQNARGMAVTPDAIVLHGFLGDNQLPGRVVYSRVTNGRTGVLMRTDGRSIQIAWVGVRAFGIEPLQITERENGDLPMPESGGLPEIPAMFRVTMIGDGDRILIRETVVHHAS